MPNRSKTLCADIILVGDTEIPIVGTLRFHDLGLIIAAGCTLIAILLSFLLIFMHAINYTKPYEQRQYVLSTSEP